MRALSVTAERCSSMQKMLQLLLSLEVTQTARRDCLHPA